MSRSMSFCTNSNYLYLLKKRARKRERAFSGTLRCSERIEFICEKKTDAVEGAENKGMRLGQEQ